MYVDVYVSTLCMYVCIIMHETCVKVFLTPTCTLYNYAVIVSPLCMHIYMYIHMYIHVSSAQSPGDHHFFGRKFEAIVNHDIIHQLDSHLYGHYPEDTPALFSYWESVFHMDDDLNFPYNARYSTYQSFLRLGLARLYEESKDGGGKCEIPRQAVVKEVTILMVKDIFRGLVVTLRDAMSDRLSPPEFEVLFSPYDYLQKYTVNSEVAKRIWGFEVRGECVRD